MWKKNGNREGKKSKEGGRSVSEELNAESEECWRRKESNEGT